jgi:murein DD-endopeptidase MepM/ murein hydrolase activator NlpD
LIYSLILVTAVFGIICSTKTVSAQASTPSTPEIESLNAQIKQQKSKVSDLDSLISATKSSIVKRQNDEQTLANEIALLDNQITENELNTVRTQTEIHSITLEIDLSDKQIALHEDRIAKQKDLITSLIKRINMDDAATPLETLLQNGTLSKAFAQYEETRQLSRDLETTLGRVKDEKNVIEKEKQTKVAKQNDLESARERLKTELLTLESQRNFKASLVAETQSKEQEYQRILYELHQQQQSADSEISALETRLKKQLEAIDNEVTSGNTVFSWPVSPDKGITAIFHDPLYPFRSVFEHPGEDLRAGVGTQVRAAAGGYVAWTKTGRMYGNYLMIVHSNGLATIYAHLSKFIAKPDTFVERGEIIGLSGGKPGMQGAGLSTGPHLHFEVRKDGIPVNPENYLPAFSSKLYDSYAEYKALKIRM